MTDMGVNALEEAQRRGLCPYPAGHSASEISAGIVRLQQERDCADGAVEALRGQIAALRGALDSMWRYHSGLSDHPAAKVLNDTAAAAREHDGVVRARAFENAFEEAFKVVCSDCDGNPHVTAAKRGEDGLWRHRRALPDKRYPWEAVETFPCHAAALREKARKP